MVNRFFSKARSIQVQATILGAMLLSSCATFHRSNPSEATYSPAKVTQIDCRLDGTSFYQIDKTTNLGIIPRTVDLADKKNPGQTHKNPDVRDWDKYIRAASGVLLTKVSPSSVGLLIAQDSVRQLASVTIDLMKFRATNIAMVPVFDSETIKALDAPDQDYQSFRKKRKADFEAMTELPDGRTLVLGSGSDIKTAESKESKRSDAILIDKTGGITRYSLLGFYQSMLTNRDIVGPEASGEKAQLNIEGVAITQRDGNDMITFAHRGNTNSNGHNSLIDFNLSEWLKMLKDGTIARPMSITVLTFPYVTATHSSAKTSVPITVGDILTSKFNPGITYLPVGAEAEYTDLSGQHHDGEVIMQGIAKLNLQHQTCTIFRARGDNNIGEKTRYGKFEGLAEVLVNKKTMWLGIIDADAETVPSKISILSGL